ncbi:MAG: biotin--protein ligase [Desulfovibrionaceae bacterium]|nr:biotin--protein ligase [Desulfovibrionaceae bacterium]
MIDILWDEAHLWGYLARHAVEAAGLPCRLLRGSDIAQGGLSGKVLLVPGGSGRGKARALGEAGLRAVRRHVERGARYLGFCGGAGLALSGGLGLCPWGRASMADRWQHRVSGWVECAVTEHPLAPSGMRKALLPVWWPGRFQEGEGEVEVLARCCAPGPDLYVDDMALSLLSPDVLEEWRAVYGVNLRPTLLDHQPCVLTGVRGKGAWLISYSHLETPCAGPDEGGGEDGTGDPPDASRWFLHILEQWTGESLTGARIPPWQPDDGPVRWDDSDLLKARAELAGLTGLAVALGLLFRRTSWLMGWKSGVPGAQINNLRVALGVALSLEPTDVRLALWRELRAEFRPGFARFCQAARSWLLARRLADTLDNSLPGILPKALLVDQKNMLFGSPMSGGGLCGRLLDMLESLVLQPPRA